LPSVTSKLLKTLKKSFLTVKKCTDETKAKKKKFDIQSFILFFFIEKIEKCLKYSQNEISFVVIFILFKKRFNPKVSQLCDISTTNKCNHIYCKNSNKNTKLQNLE
jgi:hypothetical protein